MEVLARAEKVAPAASLHVRYVRGCHAFLGSEGMHLHDDSPSLFSVTANARHLRKRATRSEVLLWQQLRGRKLGVRFRRQHPFGRYVVDFYAACARLVVEVDGGVHERQRAYDSARQADIERLYGVRFVRVSAEIVERDPRAAAEIVRRAL